MLRSVKKCGGVKKMPYNIRKRAGKRKWKIVETKNGHTKTVGSSLTKRKAQKSIIARNIHEKR